MGCLAAAGLNHNRHQNYLALKITRMLLWKYVVIYCFFPEEFIIQLGKGLEEYCGKYHDICALFLNTSLSADKRLLSKRDTRLDGSRLA